MLTRLSSEVFAAKQPICSISEADIDVLQAALVASPRGRVRINLHPDKDDTLHEMIIAIDSKSYIRPHKHPGKSEALHLLHGTVDIAIFSDNGDLIDIVALGVGDPERSFYYRMSQPFFHTLVIRSDMILVHEITNGPFEISGTIQADFAPAEEELSAAAAYRAALETRANAFERPRR